MQPLAKHLADFLTTMLEQNAEAYCRRCLTCWTLEYGEKATAEVLGRLPAAARERLSGSCSTASPPARRIPGRS